MSNWPLNDSQLLVAVVLGIMLVALIVTMLGKARVTPSQFARLQADIKRLSRLQADVKRLSEEVKQLQATEERRFIKELNAPATPTKSTAAVPQSAPADGNSSKEAVK